MRVGEFLYELSRSMFGAELGVDFGPLRVNFRYLGADLVPLRVHFRPL